MELSSSKYGAPVRIHYPVSPVGSEAPMERGAESHRKRKT